MSQAVLTGCAYEEDVLLLELRAVGPREERRSSSQLIHVVHLGFNLHIPFLKSFLTEEIGRQGVTCKTVGQSHRDVSTVHTHAYGAPPKSALPNTPTFTLRKNLASSHSNSSGSKVPYEHLLIKNLSKSLLFNLKKQYKVDKKRQQKQANHTKGRTRTNTLVNFSMHALI